MDYEGIVVGTSVTPVTATVTHTRTISRTATLSGEISATAEMVVGEIKAQINTSAQRTLTIAKGEAFSTAIPARNQPVELRDGIKIEHYLITEFHQGINCMQLEYHGWADVPYRWFEVVNH